MLAWFVVTALLGIEVLIVLPLAHWLGNRYVGADFFGEGPIALNGCSCEDSQRYLLHRRSIFFPSG